MAVDSVLFRQTLAMFCTGVAVVTGRHNGAPIGFTVQSLVSLSISPQLIGFSAAKTSLSWPRIRPTRQFCVNILSERQESLCSAFARPATDRFENVAWQPTHNARLPVIDGALAYIVCDIDAEHDAGDHSFIVGRVETMELIDPDARPLLYFRGTVAPFELQSAE